VRAYTKGSHHGRAARAWTGGGFVIG